LRERAREKKRKAPILLPNPFLEKERERKGKKVSSVVPTLR